jgi:hypothetical protein
MAQLYFLSVASLLFAGLLLASEFLSGRIAALEPLVDLSENRGIAVTAGIVTLSVGVIKLFVRAPFDAVVFAGDLLPALVGIGTGLLLVFSRVTVKNSAKVNEVAGTVLGYRTAIGIGAIIIGLIHFLVPAAVIL